jgi:hypothetical protein
MNYQPWTGNYPTRDEVRRVLIDLNRERHHALDFDADCAELNRRWPGLAYRFSKGVAVIPRIGQWGVYTIDGWNEYDCQVDDYGLSLSKDG